MANSYLKFQNNQDNIVQFRRKELHKMQPQIVPAADVDTVNEMEQLEQESHLFIVVLGTVIGAILALFIGYHLNTGIVQFLLLSILPVFSAYFLRRVYIYTLTHS
ncbi:FUSC family protein [Acinetobacter sp. ANC 7454]|uniref:FUSC family protein n=1 Tax=Acinetobacter thermotolerans TaxID=3151487 RepID=UPI00325AECA4